MMLLFNMTLSNMALSMANMALSNFGSLKYTMKIIII